jgi:hypothetical protein
MDPPKKKHGTQIEGARIAIVSSLEQDGVTLEGFRFRIVAYRFRPERQVTLQLEQLHSKKWGPFTRIDWRSRRHLNHRVPESPLHRTCAAESHVHALEDNSLLGWPQILATDPDLPLARTFKGVDCYADLLTFAGTTFGIDNLDGLEAPPWEASLT